MILLNLFWVERRFRMVRWPRRGGTGNGRGLRRVFLLVANRAIR